MKDIIKIFMDRDELTEEEAREKYDEMRMDLWDAFSGGILTPDDIMMTYGLESDYIMELI